MGGRYKGNAINAFRREIPGALYPELRDIVWELRNIVASVAPEATEVARRHGLVYFDQQRGGPVSAGICQIMILSDHIRPAFIHGAFLPDPGNPLEGDQRYKRFERIVSFEQAPWEAALRLVLFQPTPKVGKCVERKLH